VQCYTVTVLQCRSGVLQCCSAAVLQYSLLSVTNLCRVLLLRPEELKENFEEEAPASAKDSSRYARNFLEYCCFRALAVGTQVGIRCGQALACLLQSPGSWHPGLTPGVSEMDLWS